MSERRPGRRQKSSKMHFPIRAGHAQRTLGRHQGGRRHLLRYPQRRNARAGRARAAAARPRPAAPSCSSTPTGGEVTFGASTSRGRRRRDMRRARRHMQMIFQDPYASLNPQMRVGEIIARPLRVHGIATSAERRSAVVAELMEKVGLNPAFRDRYPHEFSGGQRQRIGIARALAHLAGLHRLRRADLGARCLDPGPDRQSAGAAARGSRPHLPVHRP